MRDQSYRRITMYAVSAATPPPHVTADRCAPRRQGV